MRFYDAICSSLRDDVRRLRPSETYYYIRDRALDIAIDGPGSRRSAGESVLDVVPPSRRSPELVARINRLFRQYEAREGRALLAPADDLAASAEAAGDTMSRLDCLHVKARVHIDAGDLDAADEQLDEILDASWDECYEAGFVRAIHEKACVADCRYDLLKAEAGFRFSLDYYGTKSARADEEGTPPRERKLISGNFAQSLRCLCNLGRTFDAFLAGPVEAMQFLERLDVPAIRGDVEAGFHMLEIRSIAVLGFSTLGSDARYVSGMQRKAERLREVCPGLLPLAEDELSFLTDLRDGRSSR